MKIFCENCMGENNVDENGLEKTGYRAECSICGHLIYLDSEAVQAVALRKVHQAKGSLASQKNSHEQSVDERIAHQLEGLNLDDLTSTLAAEFDVPKSQTTPAELQVLEGSDAGQVFRLDTHRVILGRKDADVILNDRLVSRHHAVIEAGSGRYLLKDLNSTNGTFLNGRPIGMEFLKHGDEIQLGSTLIRFTVVGMESKIVILE